ncbi:DUF4062 domain-containing protein [uncultured Sulfitobacter sp.]|uniref:DUF4062 domain-containing protein n=1 Tax=uncultured Sulfitobacter sp. TaxID=191468 RepID=UPI0030D8BC60
MSDKKFQVFISSTYEDLKDERKAVEQTIIRAGDFPVGMEAFPAADEEQFEFIKTVISQCDYYILLIAGRYGSLASDGKSYTEKEYAYTVEIGVPVLVMLRDDRGDLPVSRTETNAESRDKLEQFIQTASTGRVRKGWTSIDGLKLAVREALDHAKATKQRPGWIRGDQSSSTDTLEKLVSLQEQNEKLKQALQDALPANILPENLAGLDTPISVHGQYTHLNGYSSRNANFELRTDFGEIFSLIAPHLMQAKQDSVMSGLIGKSLWQRYNSEPSDAHRHQLKDEIFQTIKIQLMALGLVSVEVGKTVGGGVNLFWNLTPKGSQEMLLRRALTTD